MTCDTLGTICYELSIKKGKKDTRFRNSCYPACKRIKYSLEEAKKSRLNSYPQTKDIIGEDFYNYFYHRLFDDMRQAKGISNFYREKFSRYSLIHINFDDPEVLTVTKDAKITLSDIVGNVGGTLGVFIGFSFLSLLDKIIDFVKYIHHRKN